MFNSSESIYFKKIKKERNENNPAHLRMPLMDGVLPAFGRSIHGNRILICSFSPAKELSQIRGTRLFFHAGVTRHGLGLGFKVHSAFLNCYFPLSCYCSVGCSTPKLKWLVRGRNCRKSPRLHLCFKGPIRPPVVNQLCAGSLLLWWNWDMFLPNFSTCQPLLFWLYEKIPSTQTLLAARRGKRGFGSTGTLPIILSNPRWSCFEIYVDNDYFDYDNACVLLQVLSVL